MESVCLVVQAATIGYLPSVLDSGAVAAICIAMLQTVNQRELAWQQPIQDFTAAWCKMHDQHHVNADVNHYL